MSSRPLRWVMLLGADPGVRLRVMQQLAATLLTAASALIVWHGATSAGTPAAWVHLWLGALLVTVVLTYALLRSRWSERWSDPALTAPQITLGLAFAWAGYPMMGAQRALVIPVVLTTLAFGMFRLRAAQSRRCAGLSLALQGAAMAFSAWVWPRQFAWVDERAHAIAGLVLIVSMAFVADQLSRIRGRLIAQRQELNEALARIETLATHDALTGLANRRQAEVALEQVMRHQRRGTRPAMLAMVDLDHFKRINDRHGHATGDAVLVAFGRVATGTLRDTDFVARWGGEEFLMLLECGEPPGAEAALDRLHAAVRAQQVPAGDEPVRFTFSAGLAPWQSGDNVARWLDRADRALYAAKAAGRNRTVLG